MRCLLVLHKCVRNLPQNKPKHGTIAKSLGSVGNWNLKKTKQILILTKQNSMGSHHGCLRSLAMSGLVMTWPLSFSLHFAQICRTTNNIPTNFLKCIFGKSLLWAWPLNIWTSCINQFLIQLHCRYLCGLVEIASLLQEQPLHKTIINTFCEMPHMTFISELMTFKTYSVHIPTTGNICVRLSWNSFINELTCSHEFLVIWGGPWPLNQWHHFHLYLPMINCEQFH